MKYDYKVDVYTEGAKEYKLIFEDYDIAKKAYELIKLWKESQFHTPYLIYDYYYDDAEMIYVICYNDTLHEILDKLNEELDICEDW